MGESTIIGLVAIGVVLIVVIVVVAHQAEKQRKAACQTLATQHGWTYAEEDPAYVNRWEGAPFTSGHGRKAANVISGEYRGWRFTALEHRHQTTSSNGQTTTTSNSWHTVYVFPLPAPIPRLELRPKSAFGAIADWFGMQDIKTGEEEFDRRVRVRGDDEQYARLFLSGGVTQAVLELGSVQVRVHGNELLAVESGRQIGEGVPARLDSLIAMLGMIPGTIWSQYGRADPR